MRQKLSHEHAQNGIDLKCGCDDDKRGVRCELIGVEVWTSAETLIELFGATVSRFANKSTSCGGTMELS